MKLTVGGQYRHKETGTVMLMFSGDTTADFYELCEQYGKNGTIVKAWFGNYEQLSEQFEELK